MEAEKAVEEVREIKRIMSESQRRADRTAAWLALAGVGLAVLATAVLPFLAPITGIGLLIGGIVVYRRAGDSLTKGIAAAAIGAGILLIALIVLAILGLMAFTVGGSEAVEPVDVPQPMQPVP